MENEIAILKPYELRFSDLILLSSSPNSSSPSPPPPRDEIERLESVAAAVMENLGPDGPGLLAITGVPNKAASLRRKLLPVARKLALLGNEDRKLILKDHGLGSDVSLKNLDRTVSPFSMQLKYVQDVNADPCEETYQRVGSHNSELGCPDVRSSGEFQDNRFKNLGKIFKELGFCMMDLGLRLARICDRNIGGHELEQSLLESCTAKGRLIHYHSTQDNLILKEASKRNRPVVRNQQKDASQEAKLSLNHSNLWQQWHYDYGIFTVLTAPMFMQPCCPSEKIENNPECASPSGHTYLQIFNPNKNRVFMVKASSESFIVQVGESADILSNGKLRATLHSVCKPEKGETLSRETFVVFLQPAWNKPLPPLNNSMQKLISNVQNPEDDCNSLTRDMSNIVPPLSARLKDGMTFSEFSRETTKQYYGVSGLQSKRRESEPTLKLL